MGQNNQKMEKLLETIFENPSMGFNIREISKKTSIPKSTAHRYLKVLKKEGVIDAENNLIANNYTKFLKSSYIIKKLFKTDLIGYLEKTLLPSAIILFGSARKGEYTKESDIDLFIETTKNVQLDLSSFERKLKHKLQLFIESDITNLPKELFNNVINGIKLSGYIKIR